MFFLTHEYSWFRYKIRLSKTRLLVLDVDGVLTDGGLWINSTGELTKRFDVRDGLGIKLLIENDIEIVLLSGGQPGATEKRSEQLGIRHCFVGVRDKSKVIREIQASLGFSRGTTIYLGDDLNDLVVEPYVSLLIATSDSSLGFKRASHLVLRNKGGHGAVRELSERILTSKNVFGNYVRNGYLQKND